jgi:hypothetical protein
VRTSGEAGKDFLDGAIEDGVGNREPAHEKEVRTLVRRPGGMGEGFAEKGAGQGGANELGWFVGRHGHDREDGDPAAEFDFAQQGNGFANAVNLAAKAQQRGIQIAKELVDERGIALEQVFDGLVAEVGEATASSRRR